MISRRVVQHRSPLMVTVILTPSVSFIAGKGSVLQTDWVRGHSRGGLRQARGIGGCVPGGRAVVQSPGFAHSERRPGPAGFGVARVGLVIGMSS